MRSALLFSLVALFTLGCDQLTTVMVDVESESTVQGGSLLGNTFVTLGFDNYTSFDVSSSSEFQNNDATKNNIGESYVTAFKLEVMSPEGATLNFIEEMQIYINDADASGDGTLVASIDANTDTNVEVLYFDTYDYEIGQYLRADSTEVTVKAKGDEPNQDTEIRATMTFKIKLNL